MTLYIDKLKLDALPRALLTAAIAALYSEAKLLVGDFIKRYG